MTTTQEMTAYLLAFIHGLKQSGLKKMVISPGSRSTPLALLVYRDSEIESYINVDERSAAFFALGLAKGGEEPVGLLCTSGTAAANFYPAICEAEATHVPLIVLTADRPSEAQGAGAPQTMDQQYLYSSHVKKYIGLALPEGGEELERYSFWQGCDIVFTASKSPAGPVHANLPFREPLLPDVLQSFDRTFYRKKVSTKKSVTLDLPELSSWLTKKGIIIVGRELTTEEARKLIELAEYVGWPIISDPLANLSACGKLSDHYVSHADLVFSQEIKESPEVIWQFGNLPVSKNVMLFLKQQKEVPYVIIDEREQWKDWLHLGNYFLAVDSIAFYEMAKAAKKMMRAPVNQNKWISQWQEASKKASQSIEEVLSVTTFNESLASRQLFQLIKEDELLFLSNSNAIRFIDRLTKASKQSFLVYGNRGVNGIDGIISTAAGISAARKQHLYLLIGDLALFHDMNGLQMIKELTLPITIILLNNNGGGIFSFLSQRSLEKKDFDPLFSTPLNLDLKKVADLYEGAYKQPKTLAEFEEAIMDSRKQTDWTLIEVSGNQQEPVELWHKILESYSQKNDC